MQSLSGAIEREYNAHLALLSDPTQLMQFTLQAAPILSKASSADADQQQLYEELARLTGNKEALKRIEDARKRRQDGIQAAHRPRNKRKTRDRSLNWSGEDLRCTECNVALIHMHRQGHTVCPDCGKTFMDLVDDSFEGLPFGERTPVSVSSYSRHTHMAELLAQVQGTEQTDVPDEVIEALRTQLKKHRLLDEPHKITPNLVKSHLKQLKLSKWYDNGMQLATIVSGGKCPQLRLPPALVHDIHTSFAAAQEPFAQAIQSSKRTNFLAYSYFCHKRCQINGVHSVHKTFHILQP